MSDEMRDKMDDIDARIRGRYQPKRAVEVDPPDDEPDTEKAEVI